MESNKKNLFKSKTLWVNFILALSAFFPQVKELLSPENVILLMGFLNMALRLITKEKLVLSE